MTELGSFNSLYGIHRTYWDELVDIAYHFQFPLWDTYATLFNPWKSNLKATFNSLYGIQWDIIFHSLTTIILSIPFMGYDLVNVYSILQVNLSIPFMGYFILINSYTKAFITLSIPFMGYDTFADTFEFIENILSIPFMGYENLKK